MSLGDDVLKRLTVTIRNVGVTVLLALCLALLASALRGGSPLFSGSHLEAYPVISATLLNFRYIAHDYVMAGFVMGMIAAQVEIVLDRIKNR